MKKKKLSILLAVVMIVGIIPFSTITAFAEHTQNFTSGVYNDNGEGNTDPSQEQIEVLPYTNTDVVNNYSFSGTNFRVTATGASWDGMFGGTNNRPLRIECLDPTLVITEVEAVIGGSGEYYGDIVVSSGEKTEKTGVANGTTVHVTGVNAKSLCFSGGTGFSRFKDITIHYMTAHTPHNFDCKDNGDGTHVDICKDCGAYDEEQEELPFVLVENKAPYSYTGKNFKVTGSYGDHLGIHAGGHEHYLNIEPLDPSIIITEVDAVANDCAYFYPNVGISSGWKFENGGYGDVKDGDTIHVLEVNAKEFSFFGGGDNVSFTDIIVHYAKSRPHTNVYKDNCNGTHTIVCDDCGKIGDITESHIFTNKASSKKVTDATCTKAATYYVQCDKCEAVSNSEVVEVGELLPHTWDKGKITVAPTDDEEGVKTYTCSECGQTKEEKIPKTVETLYYEMKNDAESANFTLHSVLWADDKNGWFVRRNDGIEIKAKSDNIIITKIDILFGWGGNFYPYVVYSSGEKVETGGVVSGKTIHVVNINDNKLVITSETDELIQFKDITVHYKVHDHDFTDTPKDNGDGTHSFKCSGCAMYGEAVEHTYEKGICTACGAVDSSWKDLTEGKAYAQKDSDTAIMRFMWKIEATEETNITNIGAYVIPFDKFDDIATDSRTKNVQYVNPTTADGQALKNGNTFAVDVTNIPTANYDTTIWALPFVNGSVIANQLLNATVNDADINK